MVATHHIKSEMTYLILKYHWADNVDHQWHSYRFNQLTGHNLIADFDRVIDCYIRVCQSFSISVTTEHLRKQGINVGWARAYSDPPYGYVTACYSRDNISFW